jgi:hypothetical protein
VGSEHLFGNFLQLSAFSFNAPPAKSFAVLRQVALAGTMQVRSWRVVIMPNTAQRIVPNNWQSDNTTKLASPNYIRHNLRFGRLLTTMIYECRGGELKEKSYREICMARGLMNNA